MAKRASAAATVIGWVTRLPETLLDHDKAPLVDLTDMNEKEVSRTLASGLQALAMGIKALLAGASQTPKQSAEAILHAAFGAETFDMLADAVLGRTAKPTSAPFAVPGVHVKP